MGRGRTVRIIALALAMVAPALGAARHPRMPHAPQRANEPFDSFRVLDSKLSLLDQQLAALKATVSSAKPAGTRTPWVSTARRMRATIASIEHTSRKLALRYRRTHHPYGVRAFTRIEHTAAGLTKAVRQVQMARTEREARARVDGAAHALLPVVMEYQHVSGGYGAVHCSPRQWACCEPRPDVASRAGKDDACAWECVQQVRSCKGFPGPRTPLR